MLSIKQTPFSVCHPTHPSDLTTHHQRGTVAKIRRIFEPYKFFKWKIKKKNFHKACGEETSDLRSSDGRGVRLKERTERITESYEINLTIKTASKLLLGLFD